MKFINAEVLKYRIKSCAVEGQKKISLSKVMDIIDCQKVEKLESVVYCKDCKYCSVPENISGKCKLRGDFIFTDDYCSYGERRTDKVGMQSESSM